MCLCAWGVGAGEKERENWSRRQPEEVRGLDFHEAGGANSCELLVVGPESSARASIFISTELPLQAPYAYSG